MTKTLLQNRSGPFCHEWLPYPNLSRPPSIQYLAAVAGLPVEEFRRNTEAMASKDWLKITGSDEAYDIVLDGFFQEILTLTDSGQETVSQSAS